MGNLKLADHIGIVYVVAPGNDGPCKIGYTGNIQKRVANMQQGCWLPLRAFDYRVCVRLSGGTKYATMAMSVSQAARMVEQKAHNVLRDMGFGLAGEWFDITPQEAIQVVDKAARLVEARAITMMQIMSVEIDRGLDADAQKAQMHLAQMMGCVNTYIKSMERREILDIDNKHNL